MRIRAKTVILSLLGLVIVLVLAAITAIGWQVVLGPKARAVTARKFESTPARLARGKYLVEGPAACFHCHSEPDLKAADPWGNLAKKAAGWHMPTPELGEVYSRNITSDPETGIGSWTDDEIARAMQEGVSKDGTALFPIMPYLNFAHLTDEDLASVVVYVRTIPPVKNVVPRSTYVFPLNILVKTMPQPITSHAAETPRTTPVARGEYLVRVAGCGDCHTPDDKGVPFPNMGFAGGNAFHDPTGDAPHDVFSVNITQDPSGIAHYDEAIFISTLRTGQIGGKRLSHVMPFDFFKNMTDDDLKDIFAYLKAQPPVKHRISNTDPPTKCVVCGREHGLGNLNQK